MAIKQRALKELHTTKNNILRVMSTGSKAALDHVCRGLAETRDLYREGLSPQNYIAYGEIFDGLILAVRTMIENGEENFQEDVFALCQELLEHLEKETAKETRFKKEIFFLPYKASMWDSLESVWKAACEDKEHCIAYVMPIPYADRNPDQTVAAWHCERDQFPKYVPTLDWQQVNLKAWHPDIIFYHNPYDNCNAVTSVDEQYYSRNLKHCADKLVYIPYAVEEEVQPGNRAAEDAIMHRVLCPGIMNADLVIAQSEDTRQAWINILTRHTNVNDRAYWEKRVLGLGSPKIDKVLTSKREDFDMPEKWKRLIKGKKVILYVTSISPTLRNSDKVCDKLRYVFDIFRNRDDVVLWWRPHPLMKATFHAMIPQFEDEYLSLEKQYIEEGWGIYDDSSDLHRAIVWSDAYYGDYSSVCILYDAAGKKVLKQRYQDSRWLCATNLLVDDENVYIVPVNLNGVFAFNTTTGKMELCSIFDDGWRYRKLSAGWHIGNFSNNGKLYGMVQCGKSYYIYDFSEKRAKSINISNKFASDELVQFYKTHQVGDNVWLAPHHGKAIGRYNIKTREFSFYPEIFSLIQNRWNGAYPIFGDSVQARGSLWILYAQENLILQFDISSYKVCSYDLSGAGVQIAIIEYDEEFFWLYTVEGMLVKWSPETGIQGKIANPLGVSKGYGSIKCINGKIWIVASCQDVYGVLDCKTEDFQIYRDQMNYVGGKLGLASLQAFNDFLYIMPYEGNVLVRISTENNKIESWEIELTDEIREIYQRRFVEGFISGDYEWDKESILYLKSALWNRASIPTYKPAGRRIYELV